jgi:beta-lactam-binding protein with PASTA domain
LKQFIRRNLTARPLWVNILVALVMVFLMGLLFMISLRWITQHGQAQTVPSVTGKTLADIEALLEEKGFDIVVQDSVYYDSLPPTMIMKQIPEADAVVKKNRTIYVTINRIVPPDVEMPNLIGLSFRNVEMILKANNLLLGDTTFRPDFAPNAVLEQLYNGNTIAPGTKLKWGSKVSLVLGSGIGNEEMPVPKLLGLTYAEAKILLETNGLSFAAVIPDPMVRDTANAFIYRQNPVPRNEEGRRFRIRPGQTMDVWLSLEKPVVDSLETRVTPPDSSKNDENEY